MVGTTPILAATIAVRDLAASVSRYGERLDYHTTEQGRIDAALAESLGAPGMKGRKYAVLGPLSGRHTSLRLIESQAVAQFRSLRSFGWAAIEICVEDVHAVHARLRESRFEIIGPPAAISGLPAIHPMQVKGPDGEVIFLTQIKVPGDGLYQAAVPIDTLFICVLACRDMPRQARWLSGQLGATLAPEIAIPYRTLSRAFELPADHRHRIATASRDGHLFLEFDQYPDAATVRPTLPDDLPPGISVMTFRHADLDAVPGPWFAPPAPRQGIIYQGRRTGVLRSPEGALIEVIEDP